MRMTLLAVWLLVPLAAWAYHEGPGQEHVSADLANVAQFEARLAEADEDWAAAFDKYREALADLPEDHTDIERRLRLSVAKVRMKNEGLVEAREELSKLVDELAAADDVAPELLADARTAYANAQYYYTWLMRLEGYTRAEWEPEAEACRQTYRLLAEEAEAQGATKDEKHRRRVDLEAAVYLARMDLQELQGLPLPSQ